MTEDHAGWRTRGYLPHYDVADQIQHVIFRLADSLPVCVEEYLARLSPIDRGREAEGWLDACHGVRTLGHPDAARVVRDTLLHHDRQRYDLIAWCVMPTHVHVLFRQRAGFSLASVVQDWKSVTAHRLNRLLGRNGQLWAREYFDRAMVREGQTDKCRNYVLANPVKAGLCERPEDWPWSGSQPS